MTDRAFVEEIVVKMELLVTVQSEMGLHHWDSKKEEEIE